MRQITVLEALFPVGVLIVALYLAIGVLHADINCALAFALVAGMVSALKTGADVKQLAVMIWRGVKPTLTVMFIFLLIGALIGIWHLSGTIPAMIYYGLYLVHPKTFYLSVFIITGVVSMLLGTSMGTVSTAGVALAGIAHSLGLSLPVTAGAVISGAFLGDRSSPVSSSANLTAAITGTELYSNLRYMVTTIAVPLLAAAAIFFLWGQSVHSSAINKNLPIIKELAANFNLSPLVLIPPVLVLILSLFRVNISKVLITGILSGSLVAVLLQNNGWPEIVRTAFLGYNGPDRLGELRQVIKGGGMTGFVRMDLVIILSASLTGILEDIGALGLLLSRILAAAKSPRTLTALSVISSILTALITANQTMSIIIPARILLPLYNRFKIAPQNLARALADSGVMVVPLIPWNVAGLICTGVLGVPTLQYLPFALLCWLTPLAAVIFSLFQTPSSRGISSANPG